jgi:phosphoribosylaminoimidazolecarboxamide formyltransferase / IMP cyclohydrolase
MKRALISVSDKTNIIDLARQLKTYGYEIISTGGTFQSLSTAGIEVTPIEEVTHFPEMLDGRVKTLHPMIHGAILGQRNNPSHVETMNIHGIHPIELVVVNLYPFEATIKKAHVSLEEAIENIDIGGPTMLRSAAKNYHDVSVVCDINDYDLLIQQLQEYGTTTLEFRRKLANKVFQHTAAYDAMIANYLCDETFPSTLTQTYTKVMDLRYGENPHQQAAFYKTPLSEPNSLALTTQLQGKILSFNNIQDANAALAILSEFKQPCCVAVKHTNPCGVGVATTAEEAWDKAYEADKVSIFGGIVAFNKEVNEKIAQELVSLFLEVILAPSYTNEALTLLATKPNVRVLITSSKYDVPMTLVSSRVAGGLLVQESDDVELKREECHVVSGTLNNHDWDDAVFAMKVCKHVKSNAIVIAKNGMTLGIGGGQSNRVGAAKIALEQASNLANGAVLASDAFFPMPDTVELAASFGIKTIIQPGGSIKDQLSIDACQNHQMTMVFTHIRHFKHG